jgi:RNase adaptor protein for sRNA GlmZ degradation
LIDSHVILSGTSCSGKTTSASSLQRAGYVLLSVRETLLILSGAQIKTRRDLQDFGLFLENETNGRWLETPVANALSEAPGKPLVVDSIRSLAQLEAVKRALGDETLHVHLFADERELERRFEVRADFDDVGLSTIHDVLSHEAETSVHTLAELADLVIDTTHSTPRATTALIRETRPGPLTPG